MSSTRRQPLLKTSVDSSRFSDERLVRLATAIFVSLLLAGVLLARLKWSNLPSFLPFATSPKDATLVFDTESPGSCLQIARSYPEPYTTQYQKQRVQLDGPVYALHSWNGEISKSAIERERLATTGCKVIYKILDGALFAYDKSPCFKRMLSDPGCGLGGSYRKTTELLLVTLEVYQLPDIDFVLDVGNEETSEDAPVMRQSFSAQASSVGFTYPSPEIYENALGTTQFAVYQACLSSRYPRYDRIPKAVWRGYLRHLPFGRTADVLFDHVIRLFAVARHLTHILDISFIDYPQEDRENPVVLEALQSVAPIRSSLSAEDLNRYAAVLSLRVNVTSVSLASLLLSNTPVLKQNSSSARQYYEHLLSKKHVAYFNQDAADLRRSTEALLLAYRSSNHDWSSRVARANQFAQEHFSQLGVMRAMAYALAKQASFQKWTVRRESGFVPVPRDLCCEHNPALPSELVAKMTSRKH